MITKKLILIGGIAVVLAGSSFAIYAAMQSKNQQKKQDDKQEKTVGTAIPIETVGGNTLYQLSDSSGSWAGELVSPSILEIHPQSEGAIIQLNVRVGQKVSAGDIIAKLSTPPASVERADAAAEKIKELIKTKANAEATLKVVNISRPQILKTRESLIPARDAAISLAQKDIERNLYSNNGSEIELEKIQKEKDAAIELATQERDKAKLDVSLRDRTLRVVLEQAIEKDINNLTSLSGSNINIRQLIKQPTYQFKRGIGIFDAQALYVYESTLQKAMMDLTVPNPVEETALAYADAAKKLIYASTAPNDDVSMDEWKKETRENQLMLTEAVNEKKESEIMAKVKESELKKMIADRDKEIAFASINLERSRIDSESNEIAKNKAHIDSELEYLERKKEIDIRLSELDKELELSKKEVTAAEQAYATFISELSSQMITAQKSGIISGIFKNAGDYVTPETIIATVSQEDADDAFVRFRIPNDNPLPEVGTEVTVIRPGFPLDRHFAVISGVGNAVGMNGSFVAEAEFTESINWPIHTLVRILPHQNSQIFIPFTAVRLGGEENNEQSVIVIDEKGSAFRRVVQTGKAVGDTVEVIDGLAVGDRYSVRHLPKDIEEKLLKEGINAIQGMVIQEDSTEKHQDTNSAHDAHAE